MLTEKTKRKLRQFAREVSKGVSVSNARKKYHLSNKTLYKEDAKQYYMPLIEKYRLFRFFEEGGTPTQAIYEGVSDSPERAKEVFREYSKTHSDLVVLSPSELEAIKQREFKKGIQKGEKGKKREIRHKIKAKEHAWKKERFCFLLLIGEEKTERVRFLRRTIQRIAQHTENVDYQIYELPHLEGGYILYYTEEYSPINAQIELKKLKELEELEGEPKIRIENVLREKVQKIS